LYDTRTTLKRAEQNEKKASLLVAIKTKQWRLAIHHYMAPPILLLRFESQRMKTKRNETEKEREKKGQGSLDIISIVDWLYVSIINNDQNQKKKKENKRNKL